jgi:hypothetical protein
MQKWLSLSLITLTSLGAEEVDPEQLSAIYTEAIWFVVERLDELSKLVDDGLLKEEEFLILRKNIQK